MQETTQRLPGRGPVGRIGHADQLQALGRDIAAVAGGGEPTQIPNYPTHWQSVDLGTSGVLEVIVMQDMAEMQPLTFRANLCQQAAAEGVACQQLALSEHEGAWLRTYPDQPDRESLEYELTDAHGDGLWVKINNFPEYTPATQAKVGPPLSELGLNPESIRVVIQRSGLYD